MIGYSVYRIWSSLRQFPNLQRNERIMWLHVFVVSSYAVTFVGASVVVICAINIAKIT